MVFIAHSLVYALRLPEGHRFPMLKYELIPQQLLHEGTVTKKQFFPNDMPCPADTVLLTHTKEYFEKLLNQTLSASEQRKIGFPQSPALTERELIITQGTINCCSFAKNFGVALNVAGGTHHAFADRGEGFCLLNDFAVAANWLLFDKQVSRILIIDLDVHQGNGTAKLFENSPDVFTFSMHGAHNYPFHKETSDLDVPLKDGTTDDEYLSLLGDHLPHIIQTFKPDFAFYLSGVDILSTDKFGKLNVSMQGCRARDELVFSYLQKNNIPVVVSMGGGYSPDVRTIVEAHCNTFRCAVSLY